MLWITVYPYFLLQSKSTHPQPLDVGCFEVFETTYERVLGSNLRSLIQVIVHQHEVVTGPLVRSCRLVNQYAGLRSL